MPIKEPKSCSITFSTPVLEQFKELCAKEGITVSEKIRRMVKEAVNNYKKTS